MPVLSAYGLKKHYGIAPNVVRALDGVNVIVGDNAQGKTNAAEAVFLCAFGRSHRTPRDWELISRGCEGGYVGAEIESLTGSHLIEIKLRGNAPRPFVCGACPTGRTC